MLHVKRFYEYEHTFMRPNQIYESIPWDEEGTDRALLQQLEEWLGKNNEPIVSITGPLHKDIPRGNGHAGGRGAEVIVIYGLIRVPIAGSSAQDGWR